MGAYPSQTTIQAYYNSTWNDISSYIVSDLSVETGIYNAEPDNRLASTGTLSFKINNESGNFTPSTNFKKGVPILVTTWYNGKSKIDFFGRIDTAKVDVGTWGEQRVEVEALDWMNIAISQIIRAKVAESATVDEAVTSLLADISIPPDATEYDTGTQTFPTAFDSIKKNSSYYSELNNLIMSELGYIYLKDGGKTLRVEANDTRTGVDNLSTEYYTDSIDTGFALNDTGDGYLLGETDSRLIVDAGSTSIFNYTFDNSFVGDEGGLEVLHGKNILNDVAFTVYPRRLGGSTINLFKFDITNGQTAIVIQALSTYTLHGTYSDDNAIPVAGYDITTPVATTDYLFNSKADGTGTNLTANLTVASFTAGANEFTLTFTNSGGVGYLTKSNVRGKAIYKDNPIETVSEDTTSKTNYGTVSLSIRQPYQEDPAQAIIESAKIINDEKNPRNIVLKAKFLANASANNMAGFIFTDIGDLVYIKSTKPSIDKYFYVQGMRYKIGLNGIINYELILKETYSLNKGLSPLAVEFTTGTRDAVTFGVLPQVQNLSQRSFSIWAYANDPAGELGAYYMFAMQNSDDGCWIAFRQTALKISYNQMGTSSDLGTWESPANLVRNAWVHIVVTRDSSNPANLPVMYINGVPQTVTTIDAQVNPTSSETGIPLQIGNIQNATYDYTNPFSGKLKDARIYNRILTAAEVTTLYNGGTPDTSLVTDGLVFQAFAVKTEDYSSYLNAELTTNTKLIDNVGGFIGTPIASPTGRAF